MGHLVFAAGADGGKPKLLMLGRLLSGISYEVIDIMTIPLTSPFFQVYYRITERFCSPRRATQPMCGTGSHLRTPHRYAASRHRQRLIKK